MQTQRALGAMLVPLVVLSVSRKLERKRERADDAGPAAAVVGAAA